MWQYRNQLYIHDGIFYFLHKTDIVFIQKQKKGRINRPFLLAIATINFIFSEYHQYKF